MNDFIEKLANLFVEGELISKDDFVVILELARIALDDESFLDQLDLSTEYAQALKKKLDKIME